MTEWTCNACNMKSIPPCKLICPGVDPPIFCPSDGKECEWRRTDDAPDNVDFPDGEEKVA